MNLETEKRNEGLVLLKKVMFPFVRNLFIVFVVTVSLASCADLHFRKDSIEPGLLEIGQNLSHGSCKKKYVNHRDYQACINRVDENYAEIHK